MSWNHVRTASACRLRWIAYEPGFLLLVRVLPRLFRRLFLELLKKAFAPQQAQALPALFGAAAKGEWPNRYIDMPDLREHEKFALHQVA